MASHVRKVIAAGLIGSAFAAPAAACGESPYMGSVCITGNTFCPTLYMEANGQLLQVSQYPALYSLLGTAFGGNGQTTFALPDLRGRSPVGVGQGAGLEAIVLGQQGGAERVTLSVAQMPAHTHVATLSEKASAKAGASPSAAMPGAKIDAPEPRPKKSPPVQELLAEVQVNVGPAGGSAAIPIRNPYLGLRFCIAVQGVYPTRP